MLNKILVTKSSMPPMNEYVEEIKDIWESHWLTNEGIKHKELEAQLSTYLDVKNLILFSNGHLALENIIAAYKLKGEVITTPFTFVSTTNAIVRNGLKPIFCDIDPNTYTIDPDKIEELITPSTSAIIPVHVYGTICDVERIQQIAEKHNLKVIYDAAHAFGVRYNNKSIASYGDASIFSFHATKVFNTIEGGAVVTKDEKLVKSIKLLKNFGITGPETCVEIGGNAKMNEFQAAMGICNLRYLDKEIQKRKLIVDRYNERLSHVDGIILKNQQLDVIQNNAYYPVIFNGFEKDRDEVFTKLMANNIFARKYFYPLTCDFECYKELSKDSNVPIARDLASKVLTLPLYSELELGDVDRICDIILEK